MGWAYLETNRGEDMNREQALGHITHAARLLGRIKANTKAANGCFALTGDDGKITMSTKGWEDVRLIIERETAQLSAELDSVTAVLAGEERT